MPKSTRMAKILYLVNHRHLLLDSKTAIANALKTTGLVSFATSPVDLQPRRLVEEAKEVIAWLEKRAQR